MASSEETIRVAYDLVKDSDSPDSEYRRGVIELAAHLTVTPGEETGVRAEQIEDWLGAMSTVEVAVRENPGTSWAPMAVGFTGPSAGVVAFQRPPDPVRDEPIDRSCGTAEFSMDHGAINFFWGHYDMSPEQAMASYEMRMERR